MGGLMYGVVDGLIHVCPVETAASRVPADGGPDLHTRAALGHADPVAARDLGGARPGGFFGGVDLDVLAVAVADHQRDHIGGWQVAAPMAQVDE
jgi:hypothetical protein